MCTGERGSPLTTPSLGGPVRHADGCSRFPPPSGSRAVAYPSGGRVRKGLPNLRAAAQVTPGELDPPCPSRRRLDSTARRACEREELPVCAPPVPVRAGGISLDVGGRESDICPACAHGQHCAACIRAEAEMYTRGPIMIPESSSVFRGISAGDTLRSVGVAHPLLPVG